MVRTRLPAMPNGRAERPRRTDRGPGPKTSVTPADPDFSGGVAVPFINNYFLPLGMFFILFGMIVVVGAANAVNFTDGSMA